MSGGICAIVNFDGAPVDPGVLRAMTEAIAYRGPDGIHYWLNGNVGMAHLALHTTPEAVREVQPLLSRDGRLCLIADARVDNRPELIHLLTAKNCLEVDNPTDADLILAAYRCWGKACPEQIIGDYAFAIWDAPLQRLFCARDALGLKTLYYSQVGNTLCVASESQQILKHPKVPCRLDEIAAADYLVGASWDETRSMFADVHGVPLANSLTADAAGLRLERYWDIDPEFRIWHKNDAEYAEHFLEIFERAVGDRLRTQAPSVGIAMSGGMDSTSVAGVAQRILAQQNDQPHLVACSYAYDYLKECDERIYSSQMASQLAIELIYIPADNFWLLDNDKTYTPNLESPFMVDETRIHLVLNTFQARQANIWLTGHGGDSLVAGSPLVGADRLQHGDLSTLWNTACYLRMRKVPLAKRLRVYRDWFFMPLIPLTVKRTLRPQKQIDLPAWLTQDFITRTCLSERLRRPMSTPHFSDRARQVRYPLMAQTVYILLAIRWAERRAADYHMEARHPFLDRRLVTYLMSIPQDQIFRNGRRKFILRSAMRGILPEAIRTREDKTVFNSDMDVGLREKESQKVKALLVLPLLDQYRILDKVQINQAYQDYLNNSDSFGVMELWRVVTLEMWAQKHHQIFSGGSKNESKFN